MITCNHEPVLPTDVKYSLNKNGNSDGDQELFDFATFHVIIFPATAVKASIIDDVSGNIQKLKKAKARF